MAASYAVEDAVRNAGAAPVGWGVSEPSDKARLIRNLVQGAEYLMSHITHFYTLAALDYVQGPEMAPWTPHFDASYFAAPLLAAAHGGGGPIWLAVIADYVDALRQRRTALEAGAVFAHRLPIVPNFVVGGVTNDPTGTDLTNAIAEYRTRIYGAPAGNPGGYVPGSVYDFILNHYLPMVVIAATVYPGYWGVGAGCGNFLGYGLFHNTAASHGSADHLFASGYYHSGDATPLHNDPPAAIPGNIVEYLANSLYKVQGLDDGWGNIPNFDGLNPANGVTSPDPSNPAGGYGSWIKSPRFTTHLGAPSVMEVGPLARQVVAGNYPIGGGPLAVVPPHADPTGAGLAAIWPGGLVVVPAGPSVLARHAARALEALLIANAMDGWLAALAVEPSDGCIPAGPVDVMTGVGLNEAPRGALGHWIRVSGGTVDNYQCVVPTTWNASPAAVGGKGPIEQALIGTPLSLVRSDAGDGGAPDWREVPLEALRVVHSFDPCIACAVHVIDGRKSKSLREVSNR